MGATQMCSINKIMYMYTREYYAAFKREGNPAIAERDEPGGYCAK
jgi:hypothetical protein